MENFSPAGSSINSRCWKVCCWEQGCRLLSPPACSARCSSQMPCLQFLGRPCLQTFSLTFGGCGAPWLWKAAESPRLCCHRALSATAACECLCQDNLLACVPLKLQLCVLLMPLPLLLPSQRAPGHPTVHPTIQPSSDL